MSVCAEMYDDVRLWITVAVMMTVIKTDGNCVEDG